MGNFEGEMTEESSVRILIVDDEFTSRRVLENVLEEFGHCDTAKNGRQALKAFELAHRTGDPYHLITLDFLMPDLDGPSVLLRLRQMEKKNGIPKSNQVKVLMVTTQSQVDRVIESISAGCQDYVAKPMDRETLIKKLEDLGFERTESKIKPEAEDLTQIFLNELAKRVKKLQKYVEVGDIVKIQMIGHQLHGTGATYGFLDVTRIGARIEEAAGRHDWSFIRTGVRTLVNICHRYGVEIPGENRQSHAIV